MTQIEGGMEKDGERQTTTTTESHPQTMQISHQPLLLFERELTEEVEGVEEEKEL